MQVINSEQFSLQQIKTLIRKKPKDDNQILPQVQKILASVKTNGDQALFKFSKKFDRANLNNLKVNDQEINEAYGLTNPKLIQALKLAEQKITKFHLTTITRKEKVVNTSPGIKVWREFRPIEKVGLYIPGGLAAYPSTVLMLSIPAKIAGCKEIIICTPPNNKGKCNPTVLVAANLCGIKNIYKIGGAQAVGAMAYGTETIPNVYKIFGPGNQYVTTAKQLVYGKIDIDMPAGPSEIMIIADKTVSPSWLAADYISQLEHGPDSQAILITNNLVFAKIVKKEIVKQLKNLPRIAIAKKSAQLSLIIIVKNWLEAIEICNDYAPEHLEIITKKQNKILKNINNAGSVFLGKYTPEALGDYITGSNHTLPTSGYAKMYGALSTESFGKMMQIQKSNKKGFNQIAKTGALIAKAEGLDGHANSLQIRL